MTKGGDQQLPNMLTASLLALCLGPILYQLIAREKEVVEGIDGFVSVSISGLFILHLLEGEGPFGGLGLFAVFLVGFFGPLIFERCFRNFQRNIHYLALLFGLLGFLIHAAADGVALRVISSEESLPLAIVLHRLPVGLAIWWLLKPRFGYASAISVLLLTGAATVIGYAAAGEETNIASSSWLELFEAFVTGSILHVVIYPFHLDHDEDEIGGCCTDEVKVDQKKTNSLRAFSLAPESIGNLLGFLFLFILVSYTSGAELHHHGDHHHLSGELIVSNFMSLSLQSAPALLLAYLAGALLYSFAPQGSFDWLGRGSRSVQALKGVTVGLPLPVCSCGVLPYYETLIKKGVPPAAAIAFLVATPELGLDAILISFPLLGTEITLIRLAAAAVLAFAAAIVMGSFLKRRAPGLKTLPEEGVKRDFRSKLWAGVQHGLVNLVDTTAPWILVGLGLAAVSAPLLMEVELGMPPVLEVLVFSLLGLVVYVCASGATPLVAAFIAGGIGVGAGLAFLLTGPATNISTFGVLRNLHGLKAAMAFSVIMLVMAVAVGVGINLFFPDLSVSANFGKDHHEAAVGSTLQWISLVLVAALILFSFLRQGGRKFFSHITVG